MCYILNRFCTNQVRWGLSMFAILGNQMVSHPDAKTVGRVSWGLSRPSLLFSVWIMTTRPQMFRIRLGQSITSLQLKFWQENIFKLMLPFIVPMIQLNQKVLSLRCYNMKIRKCRQENILSRAERLSYIILCKNSRRRPRMNKLYL